MPTAYRHVAYTPELLGRLCVDIGTEHLKTDKGLITFDPGIVTGRDGVGFPGAEQLLGAVLHSNGELSRNHMPHMRELAILRLHHGLDAF
jgi:hypothetical protein